MSVYPRIGTRILDNASVLQLGHIKTRKLYLSINVTPHPLFFRKNTDATQLLFFTFAPNDNTKYASILILVLVYISKGSQLRIYFSGSEITRLRLLRPPAPSTEPERLNQVKTSQRETYDTSIRLSYVQLSHLSVYLCLSVTLSLSLPVSPSLVSFVCLFVSFSFSVSY